ncbi:hypothetical protein [Devosia sp. 1566]|uniref:hypothetical protein n=1 Tax=Devosia sp. 1566 TaxID=2499144 RepID=UPI000FDC3620|nr:hypothetical protein [Devosia sp. 1566]
MNALSGADIGANNASRLAEYLSGLETAGIGLPVRGGKPNMSAIAIACSFDRQVLYKNPAAASLLEDFIARHPIAGSGTDVVVDREDKPTADKRDNRIRQLEQQLAAARAEVSGLREQLRRYRHIEEHVISTGRGVRAPFLSGPSLGEIGKP